MPTYYCKCGQPLDLSKSVVFCSITCALGTVIHEPEDLELEYAPDFDLIRKYQGDK